MGDATRSTFPGIYSCSLDDRTGRCMNNASMIVDTVMVGESKARGSSLSNVRLNPLHDKVFALRTESWFEILWAPLNPSSETSSLGWTNSSSEDASTAVMSLSAYYRVPALIYTDKSKGQDCAQYDGSRFAYFEVLPLAFAIDENDDAFISWEGYFQDCHDTDASLYGLVWSIGVNKVDRSCLKSDKIQTFDECTTPHSIFYRGLLGKDHRLGNGFEMSLSPANRQLYYLSVVNREYGVNNANELWVAPAGIHKWPIVVPTPQLPNATGYQATRIIPDVASIRLRLDPNQLPRAVCQTAYKKGVFCYSFEVDDDGTNVQVHSNDTEPIFVVTEQQVAESCTLDYSIVGGDEYMTGMSTGLEVVWGKDDIPDVVLFGCFGGLPDRGNMTAVLRDGSVTQVLDGAYPGSLYFGIESSNQFGLGHNPYSMVNDDSGGVVSTNDSGKQNVGLIVGIVVGASMLALLLIHSRAKNNAAMAQCEKITPPVEISLSRMSTITSKIPVEEATMEFGMDIHSTCNEGSSFEEDPEVRESSQPTMYKT